MATRNKATAAGKGSTAQKVAGKTARRTLLDNGESNVVPKPDAQAQMEALLEEEELLVDVPRGYKYTMNDHRVIDILPGVQNMPRSIAEHWYSQAMGVKEFTPPKLAVK